MGVQPGNCGRLRYVKPFAERPGGVRYRPSNGRSAAHGNLMGARDKSQKIGDSMKEMAHYAEEQRLGHGRIEFDELGNAVWVPASSNASEEVMRRLLDDPTLAFSEDYSAGTVKRIQQNPVGLKKGYDPYDSGQLVKKQWKKKKDLRKLSDWIKSKRPRDE
jgi:hypothetical protein